MSMENMDKVQKALVDLRNEVPSDAYFSGVLSEFHSRQRSQQLVSKSFSFRLTEAFKDLWFFNPARLVQAGAFSIVVLFFTLNGLNQSWNSNSTSLVNWYRGEAVQLSSSLFPETYLTSNGVNSLGESSLARPVELAALSLAEISSERTQYVMNTTPAAYDSVVAF